MPLSKIGFLIMVSAIAWLGFGVPTLYGGVLSVGPGKTYTKPCQAAAAAQDGDTIEIDAGTYVNDTCYWYANNLTIRGVGAGRSVLDVSGFTIPNQKAIWVIAGNDTTVENIEFAHASVPDQNGAGIRQEGTGLTIRNCYFHDNEDGILTTGDPNCDILIEYSEFARNGFGNGYSHNMYIGNIRSFTLQYSYTHQAIVGQEIKSRAYTNYILYNRISNETGSASYEVSFPNGGTAYVIGNVIEQGPQSQNSTIVTFAEEGATNPTPQELYVVNNTIVNDLGRGTFVNVAGTPSVSKLINNIFWGSGTVLSGPGAQTTNLTSNPKLVNQAGYDYHLQSGSPAIDAGTPPGMAGSFDLTPVWQYVHPMSRQSRAVAGSRIDIGAYEFSSSPPPAAPANLRTR